MKQREPILWFTFVDIHEREWRIWLSSRFWCAHLKDCVGITYFDTRDIYIEVYQSIHDQNETVNHELTHAHLLPKGRRSRYVPAKSPEERMVRRLSPAYYSTLAKHGFLRWPNRPDGYAAMARAARKLLAAEEEE